VRSAAAVRRDRLDEKLREFLDLTREWYLAMALSLDGDEHPLLAQARMRVAGKEWARADLESRRGR
jgi:hypothetical protein